MAACSARPRAFCSAQQSYEVRVCTNKTCRRQGSQQVAQFGKDLALPNVQVQTCGCLGSCGNGPNMVVLPKGGGAPLLLSHMATPARLAEALRQVCGAAVDESLLQATKLRLAGNEAARSGDLAQAVQLYTEGLAVLEAAAAASPDAPQAGSASSSDSSSGGGGGSGAGPPGRHLLFSNRSGARLGGGDAAGALADAEAAAAAAPLGFTTAAIRQVEALMALQRHEAAMRVLLAAREGAPAFGRTDEYRACVGRIRSALAQASP